MFKKHVSKTLNALFPQFCNCCAAPLQALTVLCQTCKNQLPRVRFSCRRCGQALGIGTDTCGACLTEPCPQQRTIAPYWFEGTIADTLKAYKYGLKPQLARPLADILLEELEESFSFGDEQAFTGIVPIPSERKKLQYRGFNPAALLAKHVGSALHIPVHYSALYKKANSPSQVGSSRAVRLRQASGQFRANHSIIENMIRFRHNPSKPKILLIDDVLTTGATLRSASKALNLCNIDKITAVCLALSP